MENIEDTKNVEKSIDINDFKRELRDKIIEKYGSVSTFFKSEDAKRLGLQFHDRVYFYDNYAISTDKLNHVSKFLGGKTVKKKTQIVKVVKYFIED